ncbi:MAG: DNA-processing protein DprA [Altibacter sp.]|nr:DNA-processing protein DprA [Altibacter sp.]
MLSENELRYTLALQRIPNLGDASAKKLIHIIGSAEGIFKEKKHRLLKIDGIGAHKIKDLREAEFLDQAEEELQFLKTQGISFSYFQDTSYPTRLKHCLDGPILFFHKGNIDLQQKHIVSIVGTRNITAYGRSFCTQLIEELAPLKPVIVSGFAYGVDIEAHKMAMDCGLQTIACLAHGFEQIYPKTHKKYMKMVEENGGFITEFWSCDAFDRTNFLKRNRIIAGISEATVVIESAEKGGSLVTADIANSYNREVFAVPGRATDLQSQGCNNLIKSQQAHLLTQAADLVYMLGWALEVPAPKPRQTQLFADLTPDENKIHQFLKTREKEGLDLIALECKLPTHQTASLLLQLELKGVVRPLPGKMFEVI